MTRSSASCPIESVPGKAWCSPLAPYGRPGAATARTPSYPSARAVRRATSSATVASVTNGRCGPCCSQEPSGIRTTSVPPTKSGQQADARSMSPGAERPGETGRDDDVIRCQLLDRGAPETEQGRVDTGSEQVEHVLNPGLAVGRKAPQIGASDHHGPGPERHRLDHVATAAYAAVEDDLDLSAHRLRDRGQNPNRRRGGVEVV